MERKGHSGPEGMSHPGRGAAGLRPGVCASLGWAPVQRGTGVSMASRFTLANGTYTPIA